VLRVEYQNKPYALKIVSLFSPDVSVTVIAREVKSLYASVNCPYIVRFYEAYCREGSIQILLEYMDCGSLHDIVKLCGQISEDVLSECAFQLILALKYLQGKQIIHRDIKPSNILLNREGFVKLSDFGMSKQQENNVKQQGFKTFNGTINFMSVSSIYEWLFCLYNEYSD